MSSGKGFRHHGGPEITQSMRCRRRHYPGIEISSLDSWAAQSKSSLLLTPASHPITSNDFMIDILDLTSGHKLPVIGALRYANHWLSDTNIIDVVRILFWQALQLNASSIFEEPHSPARTGGELPVDLPRILPPPPPPAGDPTAFPRTEDSEVPRTLRRIWHMTISLRRLSRTESLGEDLGER
jgi:hypothetical protein